LVTFSPARLDRCENARVTLYAPSSSITNNGLPHLYVHSKCVCVCLVAPCQGSCEGYIHIHL
jgi:hypothetical protein